MPTQIRQAIDLAMNGNHGALLAQIDALSTRVAEMSGAQVGRLNEVPGWGNRGTPDTGLVGYMRRDRRPEGCRCADYTCDTLRPEVSAERIDTSGRSL